MEAKLVFLVMDEDGNIKEFPRKPFIEHLTNPVEIRRAYVKLSERDLKKEWDSGISLWFK